MKPDRELFFTIARIASMLMAAAGFGILAYILATKNH